MLKDGSSSGKRLSTTKSERDAIYLTVLRSIPPLMLHSVLRLKLVCHRELNNFLLSSEKVSSVARCVVRNNNVSSSQL